MKNPINWLYLAVMVVCYTLLYYIGRSFGTQIAQYIITRSEQGQQLVDKFNES